VGHDCGWAAARPPASADHIPDNTLPRVSSAQVAVVERWPWLQYAMLPVQELPDFLHAQDDGQFLREGRADEVAERPRSLEGVHIQELHGMERDIGRVRCHPFVVAQIQEILVELLLGELVRGLIEADSQLSHGGKIRLLRARGEARSCMSSRIRWRNGVMGTPPIVL
jgi:hypothetical protein